MISLALLLAVIAFIAFLLWYLCSSLKQFLIVLSVIFLLSTLFIVFYHKKSRLLLTVFPPKDLYNYSIKSGIDVTKEGENINYNLEHKYVGTYMYGIFLEKMPKFTEPIKTNATISISIKNRNETIFTENHSYWGGMIGAQGHDDSGVILGSYRVPDDIKLNEPFNIAVTVQKNDEKFFEKYGKSTFFLQRIGDE